MADDFLFGEAQHQVEEGNGGAPQEEEEPRADLLGRYQSLGVDRQAAAGAPIDFVSYPGAGEQVFQGGQQAIYLLLVLPGAVMGAHGQNLTLVVLAKPKGPFHGVLILMTQVHGEDDFPEVGDERGFLVHEEKGNGTGLKGLGELTEVGGPGDDHNSLMFIGQGGSQSFAPEGGYHRRYRQAGDLLLQPVADLLQLVIEVKGVVGPCGLIKETELLTENSSHPDPALDQGSITLSERG